MALNPDSSKGFGFDGPFRYTLPKGAADRVRAQLVWAKRPGFDACYGEDSTCSVCPYTVGIWNIRKTDSPSFFLFLRFAEPSG